MKDALLQPVPDLFRYALYLSGDQHTAEDLVQETLLRAVRTWATTDDSDPNPADRVRHWMFRALQHRWIDCLRSRQRQQSQLNDTDVPACHRSPSSRAITLELTEQLENAMQRLPDRQRWVLYLISVQEMSIPETAKILDITPAAVRSSLSLARSKMRQLMSDSEST